MVGDRYFTDVVFGNRHGMLTICPDPITLDGEPQVRAHSSHAIYKTPQAVRLVRGFEKRTVEAWRKRGAVAPSHPFAASEAALTALRAHHGDPSTTP